MGDNSPFFIVGAGRSGTTLLRLILTGHSRLHILPETWFIRSLVQRFPLHGVLTPAEVDEAVKIIVEHYRWPDMEISSEDFRQWAGSLIDPTLSDVVGLVYRHHLARSGKPRFGDKTPNYFAIIPQLSELFPGARFIHLIRDGRDVAISSIDAGWARYYEHDTFPWSLAMASRRSYRGTTYEAQILDVRYEDLMRSPEETVRRICSFLGEAFEPAMLEYQQRSDLVPARERRIHPKLEEPISPDAVGVWRRKLRFVECFTIEACLHRDLEGLGYSLRFSSRMVRPFLAATGWTLFAMAPILRRGIPYLQRRGLLPQTLYI
jgi:Sulfotransferase family